MPKSKPASTRVSTISDAASATAKAETFLAAARTALELGHTDVATSNAVHAGILAADSICTLRLGIRSTKHEHAADLLATIPVDGNSLGAQLARLLKHKTKAEYSTDSVSSTDAQTAVTSAARLVTKAVTLVSDQPVP